MKCSKCGGDGKEKNYFGTIIGVCQQCYGTGEFRQVNKEFLRSCSDKELAKAIYEWQMVGYAKGRIGLSLNPVTEITDWLNKEHIVNV